MRRAAWTMWFCILAMLARTEKCPVLQTAANAHLHLQWYPRVRLPSSIEQLPLLFLSVPEYTSGGIYQRHPKALFQLSRVLNETKQPGFYTTCDRMTVLRIMQSIYWVIILSVGSRVHAQTLLFTILKHPKLAEVDPPSLTLKLQLHQRGIQEKPRALGAYPKSEGAGRPDVSAWYSR